jgi:uncharacterized membrane-anchored protein
MFDRENQIQRPRWLVVPSRFLSPGQRDRWYLFASEERVFSMELDTSKALLGIHALVAAVFVFFAINGVRAGAEPVAIGLRVLLAALVMGLGVSINRMN